MKRVYISLAFALFACGSSNTRTRTTSAAQQPRYTAFSVRVTGAGRPVLFIPGLASPGSVWDGTVAHLAGKVQAHVFTLAGFAGQPAIGAPFLKQVHDQLVAYIRDQHLERPVIVGHSIGGVLSLWLAESDPDLGAIVDVEGMPFLAAVRDQSITGAAATARAEQMRARMIAMSGDQLASMMKQYLATEVSSPEQLARLQDAAARSDPTTVANAFSDLMEKDLRPELSKIAIPVLIIGASDTGAPIDQIRTVWHAQVDAIPHVDLEFVDHAKHFVMLDQPAAFYDLLDHELAATSARHPG